MRFFLVILIGGILLGSCSHNDEVIIPGNTAPPDPTISNTVYQNYVNRTYILVLGHEPLNQELTDAVALLKSGHLDSASRYNFLNGVFVNADYKPNLYEANRFNLLRDNDSADVKSVINLLIMALANPNQSQAWPVYQYELDRLYLLDSAKQHFINGSINIKEVQKRMVNNYFYDQINMNAQNFVLAVFQQLVNRSPTQNELAGGVAMVNGANSAVLSLAGASKDDFLQIILNSNDFYEGQLVQLYNKFLLRNPNSQEMATGTILYRNTEDYVIVQSSILSTNEFIGID